MNSQRGQSWMWAKACALIDEAERRHRHFYELLESPAASPAWEPPANLFARGTDLFVSIALPGARPDDVQIQITQAGLVVDAVVAAPRFSADVNVIRLEIPYGRMRRRIDLPAGRYALRENRMENGYLLLHLSGSPL